MIILFVIIIISLNQPIYAQNLDDLRIHSQTLEAITNQTNPLEHTSSVNVGRTPGVIAFESNPFNPSKIYVANYGSNTISVIDGNNNTNTDTIKVGPKPKNPLIISNHIPPSRYESMAIDNDKIYVANYNSKTLSVIDGNNYSNIKNISVGMGPYYIDIWSSGFLHLHDTIIYVVNYGSNTISVIDGNNYSNIKNIPIYGNPIGINLLPSNIDDPTGTSKPRIIVDKDQSNTISVIDGNNYSNIKNIPVERGHNDIGVNTGTIYVANYNSKTLSVIDGNNYSNIKNIPVGMGPYYIYEAWS